MFEDIEAEVAFENASEDPISDLLAKTRDARITVNAEGIVVRNVVFGSDFALGTCGVAVVAFRLAAIQKFEVLTVLATARPKPKVKLHKWVSDSVIGQRVMLHYQQTDDAVSATILQCDRHWLLVQPVNQASQMIIAFGALARIEIGIVNNHSES